MATWCESCLYEDYDGAEEPCINCAKPPDANPTEYFPKRPPKPVTNYDRIRAMTDEELALFIHNSEAQAADTGRTDTVDGWLDWLKQEATE